MRSSIFVRGCASSFEPCSEVTVPSLVHHWPLPSRLISRIGTSSNGLRRCPHVRRLSRGGVNDPPNPCHPEECLPSSAPVTCAYRQSYAGRRPPCLFGGRTLFVLVYEHLLIRVSTVLQLVLILLYPLLSSSGRGNRRLALMMRLRRLHRFAGVREKETDF